MKLSIVLTSHKADISLYNDKQTVALREFFVDNDLSQNLLLEIDALLKEASFSPTDIEHVDYIAQDAGFTTERIGQVVANTYNFVLQSNKK